MFLTVVALQRMRSFWRERGPFCVCTTADLTKVLIRCNTPHFARKWPQGQHLFNQKAFHLRQQLLLITVWGYSDTAMERCTTGARRLRLKFGGWKTTSNSHRSAAGTWIPLGGCKVQLHRVHYTEVHVQEAWAGMLNRLWRMSRPELHKSGRARPW